MILLLLPHSETRYLLLSLSLANGWQLKTIIRRGVVLGAFAALGALGASCDSEPRGSGEAEAPILASRTTSLAGGVVVTTTVDRAGVKLSQFTSPDGVERWIKSDGAALTVFDGGHVEAYDLKAPTDEQLLSMATYAANHGAPANASAVAISLVQSGDGVTLREMAGAGRWMRVSRDRTQVQVFDGTTIRSLPMPRAPLVPPDLDRYNR